MNYEEAMQYIHTVQWAGHKPGLRRTRTLLAALGSPGPIIKRFRAKARGSAGRIRKRTSHLEVILTDMN